MSSVQIHQARPEAREIGTPRIHVPTSGFGKTSIFIAERLGELTKPTPTFLGQRPEPSKTLDEQLYDALSAFKTRTALVAMHLDRDWRSRLFNQLDSLL